VYTVCVLNYSIAPASAAGAAWTDLMDFNTIRGKLARNAKNIYLAKKQYTEHYLSYGPAAE